MLQAVFLLGYATLLICPSAPLKSSHAVEKPVLKAKVLHTCPKGKSKPALLCRAQAGDVDARALLGNMMLGDGSQGGRDWLKLAAQAGHPNAQRWLKEAYILGIGGKINLDAQCQLPEQRGRSRSTPPFAFKQPLKPAQREKRIEAIKKLQLKKLLQLPRRSKRLATQPSTAPRAF